MNDDRKTKPSREEGRSDAGDATERRFNETVRNLLNTPPKPHKPSGRQEGKAPPIEPFVIVADGYCFSSG